MDPSLSVLHRLSIFPEVQVASSLLVRPARMLKMTEGTVDLEYGDAPLRSSRSMTWYIPKPTSFILFTSLLAMTEGKPRRPTPPFRESQQQHPIGPSQIPPPVHPLVWCADLSNSQPDDPASKGIRSGTKFTSTRSSLLPPSHRNAVDPGRDPGSFSF
jgi:hypothetical protein